MPVLVQPTYQFPYFVSLLAVCAVIGIGIAATFVLLGFGKGGDNNRTLLLELITEKRLPDQQMVSFSRVAGILGSLTLTALFIGVVFWVLFALFSEQDPGQVLEVWPAFAFGAALFAPYAFNQIASIGGLPVPPKKPDPEAPDLAADAAAKAAAAKDGAGS